MDAGVYRRTVRPDLASGAMHVAVQQRDPASLVQLYRALLALRRAEPALAAGDFVPIPASGDMLAYLRTTDRRRLLIVLNMGPEPARLALAAGTTGRVMLATGLDRGGEPVAGEVALRGDEGLIALE